MQLQKVLLILFVHNQKYFTPISESKHNFIVLWKITKGMKPRIFHNGMIDLSDKFDGRV